MRRGSAGPGRGKACWTIGRGSPMGKKFLTMNFLSGLLRARGSAALQAAVGMATPGAIGGRGQSTGLEALSIVLLCSCDDGSRAPAPERRRARGAWQRTRQPNGWACRFRPLDPAHICTPESIRTLPIPAWALAAATAAHACACAPHPATSTILLRLGCAQRSAQSFPGPVRRLSPVLVLPQAKPWTLIALRIQRRAGSWTRFRCGDRVSGDSKAPVLLR